jgi:SSS family solute:Na+ symporter
VTIIVSLVTKPRQENELRGLVYALTERQKDHTGAWFTRPVPIAIIVLALTLILNIIFF